MIGSLSLYDLVKAEISQRRQEGCAVPACNIEGVDDAALKKIYDALSALPVSGDFPYEEPNTLPEILAASSGCTYQKEPPEDTLYSRFYGAWLGRTIGCIIGTPLECYPFGGGNGRLDGWECIRLWQEGAGDAFPPVDYIAGKSRAGEAYGFAVGCEKSLRENIRFAESDDDIRYLVLALLVNEKYGNDFTPNDIADIWQRYLTPAMVFTAERAALINSLICPEKDEEKKIAFCHGNNNPYREWIGAQIRVDHYGYYNAGNPLAAAKAAYRDAVFSHVKNGIYGAMFFAALIAAAFTEQNIKKCVAIALTVIPKKSRLYEDIVFAVDTAEKTTDITAIYKQLWQRFRHLDAVHTNNNAAVCVAALIYGQGDFVKSVSAAVGAGWDTDCNGATVGSVAGAMNGAEGIPAYLRSPLHDTLYSSIPDFHPIGISDCAKRTYNLYRNKS